MGLFGVEPKTVYVLEAFQGKKIWEGDVKVFNLTGAPQGEAGLCLGSSGG